MYTCLPSDARDKGEGLPPKTRREQSGLPHFPPSRSFLPLSPSHTSELDKSYFPGVNGYHISRSAWTVHFCLFRIASWKRRDASDVSELRPAEGALPFAVRNRDRPTHIRMKCLQRHHMLTNLNPQLIFEVLGKKREKESNRRREAASSPIKS